jgi:hypothetical protein
VSIVDDAFEFKKLIHPKNADGSNFDDAEPLNLLNFSLLFLEYRILLVLDLFRCFFNIRE